MKGYEGIYRRVGCTGLLIFERDGTLFKKENPARDLMLGDISDECVRILQQLRRINVRFGFVSGARGMDVGSHGRAAFTTLARQLDGLLRVHEAMPDFWIACDIPPLSDGAGSVSEMILKAVEWYGVEKNEAIFVNSSRAGLLAANNADVRAIQYTGLPADRTFEPSREVERQFCSQSETADTQRLHAEIHRILGQVLHRPA